MPTNFEKRTDAPAHATGVVELVPLDRVVDDALFRLRPEGDVSTLATSLGRLGQLTPVELRLVAPSDEDGQAHRPRWQVVAGFRRLAALKLLQRDHVLARLHDRLGDEDAWGLALTQALLAEPLDQERLTELREMLEARGVGAREWANDLIEDAVLKAPIPMEERERFYNFLRQPPDQGAGHIGAGAPTRARSSSAGHPLEDAGMADLPVFASASEGAAASGGPLVNGAAAADGTAVESLATAPGQVVEIEADAFALDLASRLSDINQDMATAFESWTELPTDGRKLLVEQARYIAELFPFLEVPEQ